MSITKKIIITDTNIITDLFNANILEEFINFDNVYISDLVKNDEINKINQLHASEYKFFYEDLIKEQYASPAVKRMIWQSLLVVNEISTKIMGYAPKKIFGT